MSELSNGTPCGKRKLSCVMVKWIQHWDVMASEKWQRGLTVSCDDMIGLVSRYKWSSFMEMREGRLFMTHRALRMDGPDGHICLRSGHTFL